MACRKFVAVDRHTLEMSSSSCLPPVGARQYRRNWDPEEEEGSIGPPNSFTNSAGDTFEFGAFNGFCAGESTPGDPDGKCYVRVC